MSWPQWLQGPRSLRLQQVWPLPVSRLCPRLLPRPVWVQACWRAFRPPPQRKARPLWPWAQLRASLELPGPVPLSKALAQLKLVPVQSKTDPQDALGLAQGLTCLLTSRQRRLGRFVGRLLGRCLDAFRRCVRGGHGRNGHENDAHGVHRCCRCCLRLRPMGCLPRRPLRWLVHRNHSVQGQVHRLGDARSVRRVHGDLHRHARRVHGDLHAAHVLGALRYHRR